MVRGKAGAVGLRRSSMSPWARQQTQKYECVDSTTSVEIDTVSRDFLSTMSLRGVEREIQFLMN